MTEEQSINEPVAGQPKDIIQPPKDLITQCLETGNAIIDDGRQSWDQLVDQIQGRPGKIIALRGAGSINGADKAESDRLIETELVPRIEEALASGEKVTVLYDGDPDSPEKPDIGYFAGRLPDRYGNDQKGVLFVTAQKKSWYYPKREGGNLSNATGKDYVTYVFEDGKYPGDHNAFTQDQRLVEAEGYEQWYIGASGAIATSQLEDFNGKVPEGQKRQAVLFRVKNNGALDDEIQGKLQKAKDTSDLAKIAKFEGQLKQRQNMFGSHWNNDGAPTLTTASLPKVDVAFVTPQQV